MDQALAFIDRRRAGEAITDAVYGRDVRRAVTEGR